MPHIDTRRLTPYTCCFIQTPVGTDQLGQTVWRYCLEPAHVVLFALGGDFAGRAYHPGEKVLACLTHGGHILDARRQRASGGVGRVADWLRLDLDRLPLPKLPTHAEPTPSVRPYPRGSRPSDTRPVIPGPAEAKKPRRTRNWKEVGPR